jgi:hypothetical protein
MATDTKTTGLTALAANPASTDKFMIVDVSDTTMAPAGTNKYLDASYISFRTNTETLTNKTLTAPVIGDFTNAVHTHTGASSGGQLDHGLALTGLSDDDHTQYLLATGSRAGASSQAQTFTNGIVGPTWQPASDSTTAIQVKTASGGDFATLNTTDRRVLFSDGTAADAALTSSGDTFLLTKQAAAPAVVIVAASSSSTAHRAVFKGVRARGSFGALFAPNNNDQVLSFLASIYDGTTTQGTGLIDFLVDGTVSASTAPCRIAFYTSATDAAGRTARMTIKSNGLVGVGSHTPTGHLHIAGAVTTSAWGTAGIGFNNEAATFTDSSTASSGTATNAVANSLGQPTFAASNTSVTMTNAATLYIANSPAAGTNVTITNAYALWVDNGSARFDGNVGFFSTAPAAQQTSGANLTNNVTAGGTNDTIANYTDLVTYSNDAAAIRNNIYQLARKLKQVNDALRVYGLLS